ncbi:MAG TPA: hypothetical protein VFH40_08155 [Gemmatimonadales bacterium]|nr:hypothetical protein [Gemmatimonadales bacterium]
MNVLIRAATQLAIGGVLIFPPVVVTAQSVSPPIAEHQERAKSSFQLQNPSLFPITVVLEVRGFTITDAGEVIDVPLDTARIHVRLSDMSFRIPPRGTRTVFYEAVSDSLPAWFTILSAMSGAKTESGLNVRILLPHVVYLNQKTPLRKADVAITAFQLSRETRKARVQLENLSPNLGRVYQMTVSDGHTTSQPGGGFPLLPRHRRWAEVDWNSPTPPSRVTLRFARFSIDTVLVPAPTSLAADSATSTSRP